MAPDVLSMILQRQDETTKKLDELVRAVSKIAISQAEQRGARKATLYMVSTISGTLGAVLATVIKAVILPGIVH